MCSACGFPEIKDDWIDVEGISTPNRIRSRLSRAKKINTILRGYGLIFYDDGISPQMQIGNLTGRVELVLNIEQLWKVASDLFGKPIDPLEKRFYQTQLIK